MRRYSSGQRGCAVNALALPTQVRILPDAQAKNIATLSGWRFALAAYTNAHTDKLLRRFFPQTPNPLPRIIESGPYRKSENNQRENFDDRTKELKIESIAHQHQTYKRNLDECR